MAEPRSSSGAGHFPYGYPGMVCYFELIDGVLAEAHGRVEMREAVTRAMAGQSIIYAVWPGSYRSDLFIIDDLPALAAATKTPVPTALNLRP